ncbi:MAG TPA: lytic transglycosylase domain-containing protein [Thermoanaerobaculaceae bacterium]|nr:lytic transglycosylase domain-containing protein [Thermoanaerobaculaceae bacterium]HRS16793.1 lytic transglycosylase domain-containing protein [Thermoanaerobaculaceae bacterium]
MTWLLAAGWWRGGESWRWRRAAAVWLVVLALAAVGRQAAAQYLAVFVDGRMLPVKAARLLDERRIRLELPSGGTIDVPLARLDHVIEDAVEPDPQPIPPPPSCPYRFAEQPLPEGTPFAAEITAAALAADLHPRLVAAVVAAESGFQPYAVSRVGAAGLMQLMPAVWLGAGLQAPYDPASNLRVGSRHLAELVRRYEGDLALALAAYNAGAAAVEKYGGIPPYAETRGYVRRVLGRFCPEPAVTPAAMGAAGGGG